MAMAGFFRRRLDPGWISKKIAAGACPVVYFFGGMCFQDMN
jgi:hypothetical protein